MTPFLGAIDPLNPGRIIPPTDPHFSNVFLYYDWIPIYQKTDQDAISNYTNRTWHDYAISLLQTAESMNITTRPPGFRAAPIAPNGHKVTIDKDYNVTVVETGPLVKTPPDPDPSKQAIQPVPGDPSEWTIVNFTAASAGTPSIAATISTGTNNLNADQFLALLSSVPKSQLLQLLLTALSGK